jgi:hypothetical protein
LAPCAGGHAPTDSHKQTHLYDSDEGHRRNTIVEGEHKIIFLLRQLDVLRPYLDIAHPTLELADATVVVDSADSDTLHGLVLAMSTQGWPARKTHLWRLNEVINMSAFIRTVNADPQLSSILSGATPAETMALINVAMGNVGARMMRTAMIVITLGRLRSSRPIVAVACAASLKTIRRTLFPAGPG